VTAGAGIHVAKHGNYGVSSACGSSNVLEAMGIKFSADEAFLRSCIEKAGICVLHAPLFHPAMKQVAPVRRSLGVKTFFNMLGPMVNPSRPTYQLVGVFQLELARMYQYLYQKDQIKYTIVHALDGYDEISLTGSAKIITPQGESLLNPQDFKAHLWKMGDITGGDGVEDAAKIFLKVLKGQGTQAQNEVVCANASLAISTVKGCSLAHAVDLAVESLESGRAHQSFIELQNISKSWIS
jgi:anthranilate phosphoribosyltransferase